MQERSLDDWTPVIGPSAAGVAHIEGDAIANFVISPIQGTGVRYSGTYRYQDVGLSGWYSQTSKKWSSSMPLSSSARAMNWAVVTFP